MGLTALFASADVPEFVAGNRNSGTKLHVHSQGVLEGGLGVSRPKELETPMKYTRQSLFSNNSHFQPYEGSRPQSI